MAELEILALDEAGLEIEAPQAGSTYVAKRDVSVEGNITVTGLVDGRNVAADGAAASSATQPGDNISTLVNDSGFEANVALASQAEAEAGVEATKTMTPVRVAQAITAQTIQHKLNGVVAPVATNDSTEGYSVGSIWIDVVADAVHVCVDSTPNVAVWNAALSLADLDPVAVSGDSDDLNEGAVQLLLTVAERALIASAHQPTDTTAHGILSVQAGAAGEATVDATPRKIAGWNTAGIAVGTTPSITTDDITIDTAGTYQVTVSLSFNGSASKTYLCEIYKNGLTTGFAFERKLGTGGDVGSASITALVACAVTDTIEVFQWSSDGGSAMTVTEGQLSVHRVSP